MRVLAELSHVISDFRPLLIPEAGFILIIPGVFGLVRILSGTLPRHFRKKVSSGLATAATVFAFVAYGGSVVSGLGLLRESATVAFVGAGMVVVGGISGLIIVGNWERQDT